MKRSEIFFTILLLPLDFVAIFAAFIFSYYLRDRITHNPENFQAVANFFQFDAVAALPSFTAYWHFAVLLTLLFIAVFAFAGLYIIRTAHLGLRELPKIIYAVSAAISSVILISFFLRIFLLPRLVILFVWIFTIFFVSLSRLMIRLTQRNLFRLNIGVMRIGVLGDNQVADNAENQIKNLKLRGFIFRKRYQIDDCALLKEDMQNQKIDQVIIADESLNDQRLKEIYEFSINHHIKFSYIPSLFELSTSSRTIVRDFYGLPIVEIRPTPLDGWGRVLKRFFDIVFSLAVIILLLPVFILVIILQKIFEPGPLFFKHRRVGIGGKDIDIYKFRSMKFEWCDSAIKDGFSGFERFQQYLAQHPKAGQEWQKTHKLKKDPRITSFGIFLRKSNLDELPQFFNVLLGQISLVGPRPIVESEREKFGEQAGRIFCIKPGLTGLWQVSGRNELSYDERVRLNVYYVENWSFWLDIIIILKTIGTLISSKGAY